MTQIKILTLEDCVSLSDDEVQKVTGGFTQLKLVQKPKPIKKPYRFLAVASAETICLGALGTEQPSTTLG